MKTNKFIIFIFILIIVIELCTTIILLNYSENEKNRVVSSTSEDVMNYEGRKLTLKNASELLSSEVGSISKKDILNITNEYVTFVLPTAYSSKDLSDEEVNKVFNENKEKFQNCKINNSKDLIELIDELKKMSIDFNEYDILEFTNSKSELTDTTIKVTVVASVTYKNGNFIMVYLKYENGRLVSIEAK